ncbi:MAG: HAMP domain-containing histidine kinase [Candidatus Omnitrophica bacterium]|nr:HAMP domain-containing histidine kinase [Candidatus Omnitrophota bacterium]
MKPQDLPIGAGPLQPTAFPRQLTIPEPRVQPTSSNESLNPTRVLSQFNIAFSLMSIIPLLTCAYLITVRFFSLSILVGLNGIYFLMALVIALLGLLAGHQLIRDIIRRLVKTNLQLAQLNERQATFVANVSHEFRSPLAVFKGALDNLVDGLHGPLTSDQMEPVSMCQKEVTRLKRLVSDLLDLTRIEAGRLPMMKEPVVLQEMLTAVGRLFDGILKERGLSFAMEWPKDHAVVIGDRDRLQQVFVNLLANAVKFTKTGGIQVRLLQEDEAFRMEVIDTGEGIAKDDQERVFDKFERVGTTDQEGSGLGLPIARDIVELHQGRLWVESEPGKGSRFIVKLPVGRSAP